MDSVIWGFIGVIAGTIIGAASSILTTLLSNQNAFNLQAQTHRNERLNLFRQFQRENLLRLQDLLADLVRLNRLAYFEDLKAYQETQNWGGNHINQDLDQSIMLKSRELAMIIERISNVELRKELTDLAKSMGSYFIANSHEIANFILEDTEKKFMQLMTMIGVELRNTYEGT